MSKRVTLVFRTLISHYYRHKVQALFLLVGLSLGVGVLQGVLLISYSAQQEFTQAEASLSQNTLGYLYSPQGHVLERDYVTLRIKGYSNLMPIVEGRVRDINQRQISIRGVDVFANFHRFNNHSLSEKDTDFNPLSFSFEPFQTLISANYAKALKLQAGDIIELNNGQVIDNLRIVPDSLLNGYQLICDIKYAQRLTKKTGLLSSVAVFDVDQHILHKLQGDLPENLIYQSNQRSLDSTQFADAFHLNLMSIAFIAFLIGCFIAFNAARFSVLQRIGLVTQLRLCGTSLKEIAYALLIEFLFLAILAAIIGCLFSWWLAVKLVPGIGITLAELFHSDNGFSLTMGPHIFWMALTISLAACLFAIAPPYMSLLKVKPLQKNEIRNKSRSTLVISLVLFLIGLVLTYIAASQLIGFVIALCWFLAGVLILPTLLLGTYRVLLSYKGIRNYPRLHSLLANSLDNYQKVSTSLMVCVVSLATLITLATMVGSFEKAFSDYLSQTLAEDIYILSSSRINIDELKLHLENDAAVKQTVDYFVDPITVGHLDGRLRTMSNHPLRHSGISFEGDDIDWRLFHQAKGVVINQTLAFQLQVRTGDTIEFEHRNLSYSFKVLGVYFNYGNTQSEIFIDESWYLSQVTIPNKFGIGIFLNKPSEASLFLNQLKTVMNLEEQDYYLSADLKKFASSLFSRTFFITGKLSVLIICISCIGMYCASYINEIETFRQKTLLRVLGVSDFQLVGLSLLSIALNVLVALVVAIPLGLLLSYVSIYIVMYYSLGWYFDIQFYPITYFAYSLITLVAMLVSWIIPYYIRRNSDDIALLRT